VLDIGEFTASRWDDDQAERYVSALYATFQRLAERLTIGRQCDHISPGLWRVEHASHVVFFRQRPEGLLISRVLHQRMLPENQRFEDEDDEEG
jgi:toxin ParE1/3/4